MPVVRRLQWRDMHAGAMRLGVKLKIFGENLHGLSRARRFYSTRVSRGGLPMFDAKPGLPMRSQRLSPQRSQRRTGQPRFDQRRMFVTLSRNSGSLHFASPSFVRPSSGRDDNQKRHRHFTSVRSPSLRRLTPTITERGRLFPLGIDGERHVGTAGLGCLSSAARLFFSSDHHLPRLLR